MILLAHVQKLIMKPYLYVLCPSFTVLCTLLFLIFLLFRTALIHPHSFLWLIKKSLLIPFNRGIKTCDFLASPRMCMSRWSKRKEKAVKRINPNQKFLFSQKNAIVFSNIFQWTWLLLLLLQFSADAAAAAAAVCYCCCCKNPTYTTHWRLICCSGTEQ